MPTIDTQAAAGKKYIPKLVGSWGEFTSPQVDHRILYLSTTVRFSATGRADDRLHAIRNLRPVREVLDVHQLKFKELLQRDIDDHRVAHQMVPYLLGSQAHLGATFFPPILAIFLPRVAKDELKVIPKISESTEFLEGNHWAVTESNRLFRLKRLADEHGNLLPGMPLAELEWNSQLADLIVIDGQHRLMAMLAIHRTHHAEWGDDPRYQRVYQDSVSAAIARAGFNRDIELPLTILTFPELSDTKTSKLYPAARKIFVDVNKGAKSPTQSRLILHSDTDLTNIVVRELLETIRTEDQTLGKSGGQGDASSSPALLPAIQYDASSHDDEKDKPRVTRLVKLGDLRDFSNYLAFYPQWWQSEIIVKKEKNKIPKFPNFKESLAIEEHFGNVLVYTDDGDKKVVNLADIDLYNCPGTIADQFTSVYLARIGAQLSTLFRLVYPYASHLSSLEDVKKAIDLADIDGELVSEAIYSGSGTAFTLERIRDEYKHAPSPPAAAAAWKRLRDAEEKFSELYAARLFPEESDSDIQGRLLNDLAEQTRSRACLLGLVMASALFINRYEKIFGRIPDERSLRKVVSTFGESLNQYLGDTKLTPSKCHKVAVLSKKPLPGDSSRIAFNKLQQLSPENWVEFRCMWWEVLMESRNHLLAAVANDLQPKADESKHKNFEKLLKDDLGDARSYLLQEYIDVRQKQIKKDHDDYDEAKVKREAGKSALKEFFETYQNWFGLTENQFGKAFKANKNGQGVWKLD
jgi:hypothetical protein